MTQTTICCMTWCRTQCTIKCRIRVNMIQNHALNGTIREIARYGTTYFGMVHFVWLKEPTPKQHLQVKRLL